MIKITNLQLLICERIHVEALLRSKSELAAILNVAIPESWPYFPEAFSLPPDESLASDLHPTDWNSYLFIHPIDKVLIGNGGFKGEPDNSGQIEIGYEIASEYWNRGFATEAVRGMVDFAFAYEHVLAVVAHTLAGTNASNRVLQKVGMTFISEIDDPDDGKIWRWQISRDGHRP